MNGPHVPPTVPGYRVRRLLRHGSMGTLWEAQDRNGQRVALKVIDRGMGVDKSTLTRHYRREAAVVLHLEHANLVRGYDIGETEDGRPYIALEYVAGESLTDRVRRAPLAEPEAIEMGIGLARALEHMHARDIVHRDVKPDNVMLLAEGGVKLVDLGLAEEAGLDAPGCGTPGYASPETVRGGKVGPASDLWSLGITLAAAVLGRSVFQGTTIKDVLRAAMRVPLVLPEVVRGQELSEGFRRVVERLAERLPRKRYASAAEVRLDLEALRDGDRPFGVWLAHSRRRFRDRAVAALGVAALLGVGGFVLMRDGEPPPTAPSASAQAPPIASDSQAPGPDLEVEAALLFAERNPEDIDRSRALLRTVRDRPMTAKQRLRVRRAERVLRERLETRGRTYFATCKEAARKHRAIGDIEAMLRELMTWPEPLRGLPECDQARQLAAAWRRDALAPGEQLAAEVERSMGAWTDAAPPVPADVDDWVLRVEQARQDAALPLELRPTFADLVERLQRWRERAAVSAREMRALEILGDALAEGAGARESALRRMGAREETRGTDAARYAAEILALASAVEGRLVAVLEGAQGKPWAGVLGQSFWVGTLPRGVEPADVFEPGFTVWDDADPWARDASDLRTHTRDQGEMTAWLWLHGLEGDVAWDEEACGPLRRLLALGLNLPRPEEAAGPGAFWLDLRMRLVLALRPSGEAVASFTSEDPVLSAWIEATRDVGVARPSRSANAALEEAGSAFLADDPLRAWQALVRATEAAPDDAEVALLSSMVLGVLDGPLPQYPVLLLALAEARRAWDLDPTLATAPRHLAGLALRIRPGAPPKLRAALGPVTAAACTEVLRQRRDGPAMILFLAEYHAARGGEREALHLLRKGNQKWPSAPDILLALARIEASHGDPQRARKALEEAKARAGQGFPEWAQELLDRLDR